MAITQVTQVVRGLLGQQFIQATGNLKGALLGTIKGRGRNNAPGGAMENKGRFRTTVLQYPFGVSNDPMQGHYILFKINVNKQAKITRIKSLSRAGFNARVSKEFNIAPADIANFSNIIIDRQVRAGGRTLPTIDVNAPVESKYRITQGSSRLEVAIALYMPPSVVVDYKPVYNDVPIGGMAEVVSAGAEIIRSFARGEAVRQETVARGWGGMEAAIKKGAYATADTFAPGVRALAQIQAGSIISSKMELSFEGVGRREFTYTFDFIPKNEQEALAVEQIIAMFKLHSMPEWGTGQNTPFLQRNVNAMEGPEASTFDTGNEKQFGRTMTIPDTFEIEYMYQSHQNSFLNKISTCFCSGVNVAYGGDRFVAYDETQGMHGYGTPPQRTKLTLNFKEMEIITRERVLQGF